MTVWTERIPIRYCNIKTINIIKYSRDSPPKPWGVACDKFGRIIVGDRLNHRVLIYKENGKLMWIFGGYDERKGLFNKLAGIAVDKNRRIIVADMDNHRIQVGVNSYSVEL